MNNVDLRDGFMVDGKPRTIVAAGNRTDKTVALYLLDPATRRFRVRAIPCRLASAIRMGSACMRRRTAAVITSSSTTAGDGAYRQWRIAAQGGRAAAEQVREFTVGSQAEGCVADDASGRLRRGGRRRLVPVLRTRRWWRGRREIDRVDGPNGLEADIEGVSVWHGNGGQGFIVLSNQGVDSYAVYRLEGDNAFVGLFHIVADPARGIDGVSETDGLDVTSAALGKRFPDGLLVVQDGRNLSPRERQNYKYVSWRDIAESLGIR